MPIWSILAGLITHDKYVLNIDYHFAWDKECIHMIVCNITYDIIRTRYIEVSLIQGVGSNMVKLIYWVHSIHHLLQFYTSWCYFNSPGEITAFTTCTIECCVALYTYSVWAPLPYAVSRGNAYIMNGKPYVKLSITWTTSWWVLSSRKQKLIFLITCLHCNGYYGGCRSLPWGIIRDCGPKLTTHTSTTWPAINKR